MLRLVVLLFAVVTAQSVGNVQIDIWLTESDLQTGDPLKLLERQPIQYSFPFNRDDQGAAHNESKPIHIEISTAETLQTVVGYGAGLPQSSAFVLIQLKRNQLPIYNSVMNKLFGSGDDEARISVIRFPVGSCDFSIHNTSYDEHIDDFELKYFSLDADSEYIVEVLLDAVAINPELTLIGK